MTLYVCPSHPGPEQLTVNGMKWRSGEGGGSITMVACKLLKAVKSLGNKTF